MENLPNKEENKNAGYFREDNGNYSSIRLMSFVSLIASILFGLITLWLSFNNEITSSNGLMLTLFFLVGAFAPKAVQKFAEQKLIKKIV